MNLSLPQLVIGGVGALLIYAAVKNISPVQVVKDSLSSAGHVSPAGTTPFVGPIKPGANRPDVPIVTPPPFIGPVQNLANEGIISKMSSIPVTSTVWKFPTTGKL